MMDYTNADQNLSLYDDKLQFYLVMTKDNELSTHMEFAREVRQILVWICCVCLFDFHC